MLEKDTSFSFSESSKRRKRSTQTIMKRITIWLSFEKATNLFMCKTVQNTADSEDLSLLLTSFLTTESCHNLEYSTISKKRKCMVQIFETYCTYLPTCCLNGERSPSVGLTRVQPRKWSVDSEDRSRTHAKLVERAKMPAFHKPYSMSKQKLLGVSIKIWLLGWTIILFNLHKRTHASHRQNSFPCREIASSKMGNQMQSNLFHFSL